MCVAREDAKRARKSSVTGTFAFARFEVEGEIDMRVHIPDGCAGVNVLAPAVLRRHEALAR
jgi:hypothetical protein